MFISTRSACAIALGAALLIGGAGELAAQGRGGGGGGGRGGGAAVTPLSYRQALMNQFQANMQALTAVRGGAVGAPGHVLGRALVLQQLTMMASDAFPAGSAGEGSRALPAIWENPSEFAARVQALQAGANALVEAARSGNGEQVASAQMALQQTCGGCHNQFRGPPPGY